MNEKQRTEIAAQILAAIVAKQGALFKGYGYSYDAYPSQVNQAIKYADELLRQLKDTAAGS